MTSILKADTIQDTDGNNIINESSDTITIGASGDTTNIVGTLQNNGSALISGITMADQWRINSASTLANGAFVTANWEQVDTDGYGTIGSAMTESSGVFTFPSTGIYLIIGKMVSYMDAARLYVGHGIYTTTDNSSYTQAADAYNGIYAGYAWSSTTTHFIFDVTNTSTHKIKMGIWTASSANTIVNGGTASTETGITFVRLGDT
jgi:hypothetical protein|tara:strand:+ start:171 stop:785 length:615 start_codon:yes stop_codon:yes gene_type:complete